MYIIIWKQRNGFVSSSVSQELYRCFKSLFTKNSIIFKNVFSSDFIRFRETLHISFNFCYYLHNKFLSLTYHQNPTIRFHVLKLKWHKLNSRKQGKTYTILSLLLFPDNHHYQLQYLSHYCHCHYAATISLLFSLIVLFFFFAMTINGFQANHLPFNCNGWGWHLKIISWTLKIPKFSQWLKIFLNGIPDSFHICISAGFKLSHCELWTAISFQKFVVKIVTL